MSGRKRDRFGQRPLYYAVREGRLLCARRVSRLQRRASLARALDARSAAAALGGVLPPDRTPFRGVGQLPPGWSVRLTAGRAEPRLAPGVGLRLALPARSDDTRSTPSRLSRSDGTGRARSETEPLEAEPARLPGESAAARLLAALRRAVRRLGPGSACALSGGLDSGLVLALMSAGGRPVRAYTLRSDFTDDAELRAAETLAAGHGAEHTLVVVPEGVLPDHVAETVRACEMPIWNGAAVARHLFFRAVRRHGESALLGGVGADELLCGNPAAMAAWPARRQAEVELAQSLLTPSARRALQVRSAAAQETSRAGRSATAMDAGRGPDHALELLRRVFVETVLVDSTLPPECRTSVVEGIEARLPYLDDQFADVALELPAAACVRDGVGKWPLREAARGLVAEEIRTAPKTARLAPSGGMGARARARWLELYAAWLRPERLEPLECVSARRARALLDRFAARPPADPARAVEDAIFMRLVSLAILATPA